MPLAAPRTGQIRTLFERQYNIDDGDNRPHRISRMFHRMSHRSMVPLLGSDFDTDSRTFGRRNTSVLDRPAGRAQHIGSEKSRCSPDGETKKGLGNIDDNRWIGDRVRLHPEIATAPSGVGEKHRELLYSLGQLKHGILLHSTGGHAGPPLPYGAGEV